MNEIIDNLINTEFGSTEVDTPDDLTSNEIPDNTQQEAQVQDNETQVDSQQEQEEVTPDYFKTPSQFENQETELDWYKTRFNKIADSLEVNEEKLATYQNDARDKIFSDESLKLAGMKEAIQALEANPRAFMVKYIPELSAEYGLSPILSEQEMAQIVKQHIDETFGKNFQFNAAELMDPSSLSFKAMQLQASKMNELVLQNSRNQELMDNWNSNIVKGDFKIPTESEIRDGIEQSYESEFKPMGISREEFDTFVADSRNFKMTPMNIHQAMYFKDYLKGAYQAGLTAGKSSGFNKSVQSGAQVVTPTNNSQETTQVRQATPVNINTFHSVLGINGSRIIGE